MIAIIGILAAIILIVVQNAKDKARDAVVESSLRSAVPVALMCRDSGFEVVNGSGQTTGKINTNGSSPICSDSSIKGDWPTLPQGYKNKPFLSSGNTNNWSYSIVLTTGNIFTCNRSGCSLFSGLFDYVFISSAENIDDFTFTQKDFIAQHFNIVEITKTDNNLKSNIEYLKSKNPGFKAIKYINPIFDYSYKPTGDPCYLHNPASPYLYLRLKDSGSDGYGLDNSSDCLKDFFIVKINNDMNNFGFDGVMADDESAMKSRYDPEPLMTEDGLNKSKKNFLSYLKTKLSDKIVIFNGLYHRYVEGYGLSDFIDVSDGGIKEGFVAKLAKYDQFLTEAQWKVFMDLILADFQGKDKFFLANCKLKPPLVSNDDRMFCFSSFLLIYSQNSPKIAYSIKNIDLPEPQYYPEMDINIGLPLETKNTIKSYLDETGLYVRPYEKGKVIVNPTTGVINYTLDKTYSRAIPSGGGVVQADGTFRGTLSYQDVSGTISVPSQTGIILLNK